MKFTAELLNKRLLLETDPLLATIIEVKLEEISPSNKRIKLRYQNNMTRWIDEKEFAKYELVEILADKIRPTFKGRTIKAGWR